MVMSFPDGGWLEYEPETGQWLIKAASSVVINASDSIEITTTNLKISAAKTSINGTVEQSGGNMSSNGIVVHTHKHGE
jgi:phage baseplate assembly protein V